MTAPVFVDTNVLVYARDDSDPHKRDRCRDWLEALWRWRSGRLSWQVLSEYYVTVTRKLPSPLPVDIARQSVLLLAAWKPMGVNQALMESAWALQDSHSLSWWDALIVAAALEAGCSWLLSEDMQAGHRFGDMEVINPFAVPPAELAAR